MPDATVLGRQKSKGGYEDNRVKRLERKSEKMLGRQKRKGGYEENRVNRLERKAEEFCLERPRRATFSLQRISVILFLPQMTNERMTQTGDIQSERNLSNNKVGSI